MSPQVLSALLGCIGLIIGALPTYMFMRKQKQAELDKLHAETDKIRAEADRIRAVSSAPSSFQQPIVRVLFAAADPGDSPKLRLGEEIRGITRALRGSKYADKFLIEQLWAVRWADLRSELLRNTPDVLHICGLGSTKGGLLLEDDSGGGQEIPNEAVTALLSLFSDRLRLVVLNTRPAENLYEALAQKVDFVIGPTVIIADLEAIRFSAAFYEALADGKPVNMAFEFAVANSQTKEGVYKLFAARGAAGHLLPQIPSHAVTSPSS